MANLQKIIKLQYVKNIQNLDKYHNQYKSYRYTIKIFNQILNSIEPDKIIKNRVSLKDNKIINIIDVNGKNFNLNLDCFDHVYLVGFGKAAAKMTLGLSNILKNKIQKGAITVPYGNKVKLNKNIYISEASHPFPDNNGIIGSKKIIDILSSVQENSLIFGLISGGGSSLLPYPVDEISLKDKQVITKILMENGASIHELNILRKHLSKVKGGKLPTFIKAKNWKFVSIILSDVVGDNLDIIASGPTVPDSSTIFDAIKILKKYHMWNMKDDTIHAVRNFFLEKTKNKILKSPKKLEDFTDDNIYTKINNIIIGNNSLACKIAHDLFTKNNISCKNLGSDFEGRSRDLGKRLSKLIDCDVSQYPIAFVFGGESTVKLQQNIEKKGGVGGRNQESVLYGMIYSKKIQQYSDYSLLSAGTDGIDGNSEAAGGIITPKSVELINTQKLDVHAYLKLHNSNTLLHKIHSEIITGKTGTNLNDVVIFCVFK